MADYLEDRTRDGYNYAQSEKRAKRRAKDKERDDRSASGRGMTLAELRGRRPGWAKKHGLQD